MPSNELTVEALIFNQTLFTAQQFMKQTGLPYSAAQSAMEEVAN